MFSPGAGASHFLESPSSGGFQRAIAEGGPPRRRSSAERRFRRPASVRRHSWRLWATRTSAGHPRQSPLPALSTSRVVARSGYAIPSFRRSSEPTREPPDPGHGRSCLGRFLEYAGFINAVMPVQTCLTSAITTHFAHRPYGTQDATTVRLQLEYTSRRQVKKCARSGSEVGAAEIDVQFFLISMANRKTRTSNARNEA